MSVPLVFALIEITFNQSVRPRGSLTRPPASAPGNRKQGARPGAAGRSGGQRICGGFALAGVGCAVKGSELAIALPAGL